jgi:hypothetical protein
MNQLNLKNHVNFLATRNRECAQGLKFDNFFKVRHLRGGKLLGEYHLKNNITDEGVNTLFNVMFNTATQIANNSWFIGFIDNGGPPTLANADVMNSHAGWTEFTNYSQSTRVAWGSNTAGAGVRSVTNSSAAVFNINGAGGTVYGIFVTSNSTKGGTSGKLWSTAAFASAVPVSSGDQLNITYTASA